MRTPTAAIIPSRSSGLVSRRTSTAARPAAATATASAEENTTSPTAAPGEAGTPVASSAASEDRSNCGNISCISWSACHPFQRLVDGDELLVDELGGDAERRRGGALADPGLEHPELAALDRELDVAEVAVVGLQASHDGQQLFVRAGVEGREVVEGEGVADARDDVLALGVGEVVAVHARLPGRRIAGETDAGARGVAEVAEHHGAHVDRGAEVVGDALATPVEPRAVGVPRPEDGLDGEVELLAGVLRERRPWWVSTTDLKSSTSFCRSCASSGPTSVDDARVPARPVELGGEQGGRRARGPSWPNIWMSRR